MFQGAGFGASSTAPFGQSTFGKPATTGFGNTSVFGSTPGTSLFGGATTQPSGGLFGSTTATPAFGQPQSTQPTFGGFPTTSTAGTGLFGSAQNANTSTGLFGSSNTSAFGQPKPAFGGFGATQPSTGLFGQPAAPATQQPSLFGSTATQPSTGLFGASTGFGNTATAGGTTIKFVPLTGNDTMVKNGISSSISTRHQCITCMKEYESKSLEELRLEDYASNRKGPQQGAQGNTGLFGATTAQPSLFGAGTSAGTTTPGLFGATENKGLFGNTQSTFGAGTTSVFGANTGNNLFGKPAGAATPFGATTTTSAPSFGFNTPTTSNPFGAAGTSQFKPFGAPQSTQSGLFGSTSQPTNTFGTATTGFSGFGAPQQTGGFFQQQNKPAFSLGSNTGYSGFSFGQQAPATTSVFGKPASSGIDTGFASTVPTASTGFGATPLGSFGQTNQTPSLFNSTLKGSNTGFSFGQTNTTNALGSGLNLGGGSSLFGSTANKPGGLFSGTNTTGNLFAGSTFGSTGSPFSTNTNTGLGASTFSLGGSSLNPLQGGVGSSAGPNQNNPLNQHMQALASMPFGDSPLFKNLLPATGKTDELIKPTSPAAQKALLTGQNFKVSPRASPKVKVKPIGMVTSLTKKSLFDGLDAEEEETNGDWSASRMRSNPKSLVLKPEKRLPLLDTSSTALLSPIPGSVKLGDTMDSPGLQSPQFRPQSSPKTSYPQMEKTPVRPINKQPASPADLPSEPVRNNRPETSPEPARTDSPAKGSPVIKKVQSPVNNSSMNETANQTNVEPSSTSSDDSELEDTVAAEVDGDAEDHPTGIVLRRAGYYTIPPLDDLTALMDAQGRCIVDNFTVGRLNYGNVFFPESFNVAGLNLDRIVHFRHKEIIVYPEDDYKPSVGEGLNRRAQVTLDRVWPTDKVTRLPISDPERIAALDYESKLRQVSAKHGMKFVEYRPQTGSWVFKVDHFSKYGLTDSDEEDGGPVVPPTVGGPVLVVPGIPVGSEEWMNALKVMGGGEARSLQQQMLLQAKTKELTTPGEIVMGQEDEDMDEGITTPFDLILDDEDANNVALSPTSKLANRIGASSHKVQLMKASFFDHELEGELMDVGDMGDSLLHPLAFPMGRLAQDKLVRESRQLERAFSILKEDVYGYRDTSQSGREAKEKEEIEEEELGLRAEPELVHSDKVHGEASVCPATVVLRHKDQVLPLAMSVQARLRGPCLADLALMKGRSFRVGWGPGSRLLALTSLTCSQQLPPVAPIMETGLYLQGRAPTDFSHNILQTLRLQGGQGEFSDTVLEHLEVALRESTWTEEDGVPHVVAKAGLGALKRHVRVSRALVKAHPQHPHMGLAARLWALVHVLWADLHYTEVPDSHACAMARRSALSDWIRAAVGPRVREALALSDGPAAVLALLSGAEVGEACRRALAQGDQQLSLLIAQAGSSRHVRGLVLAQLEQWRRTQADRHIDRDRLRCLLLVAGVPTLPHLLLNTCEGLDWLRALALHLWYICSPSASVTDALLLYERAFGLHPDDQEPSEPPYAQPPVPGYLPNFTVESNKGHSVYHLYYHLLKLFSHKGHPLEKLLNPATHTPDCLDYRISWLLMRVLGSLGYSHLSEYQQCLIHSSFASQLESHDLWHWAVFVLLHVPNPAQREEAVLSVLQRHIQLKKDDERETFLKEKLKVPLKWISSAKATRALACQNYHEAAKYLIESENWNLAHSVIMSNITSKAIINDKYNYLETLLAKLAGGDQTRLIHGWREGGDIVFNYLRLVREVESIVVSRDPAIGYHLEKLYPQLIDLCKRIKLLPSSNPVDSLAKSEMAKRTCDVLQSLVLHHGPDSARQSLPSYVSELPIPGEYAQVVWQGLSAVSWDPHRSTEE